MSKSEVEGFMMRTPIDIAFAEAKRTGQEFIFYNLFLKTNIFIPTLDLPKIEGSLRTNENDKISPIVIESEGIKYLMLFDSKERLVSWAKREVGFAMLSGHVIVEMMGYDLHWALNVGTDYVKTFVPEEIKWLKESFIKAATEKIAPGTQVLTGAPAKIPPGLIESLKKNLSTKNSEVKSAYLGQVFYIKEGEKPHLALVLDITTKDKSMSAAICRDLGASTKGLLGESEYIDILINEGKGIAFEITKVVKPFYTKSGWLKSLIGR